MKIEKSHLYESISEKLENYETGKLLEEYK